LDRTRKRWLSLALICVSLLVIALDNTILNVALPSIAKELGASTSELQWIVDAYVLVFASLLLTMGSIGDKIGRRKALQIGLALFGVGSLAAGLSTTTQMLTAMRAFMGVGGAIIMPATLSLVTATFRDPRERTQAIAIWAAVFGLGIGLGPVIGGALLEHYSWGAVFFVNLPIVVVAIVGDHYAVEESKDERAPRPDIPGVILSITGLFALVYAIIQAGRDGWTSPKVLAAFAAALVLLGTFAWWESRATHPLLPVRFFRNRSFSVANAALVLVMFVLFGTIFFLSQYFQSVQGYTALGTGVRLLPLSAVVVVASALSARLVGRIGIKLTVGFGLLVAAGGMLLMWRVAKVDTGYVRVLSGLCLTGLGLGLTMPSATNSVMGSVPVSKAGVGSAMNDTTRQIGGALGVAVLGSIMNSVYVNQVTPVLDPANPLFAGLPANARALVQQALTKEVADVIKGSIQGAHLVAQRIPVPSLAQALNQEANKAFVAGMTDALAASTLILLSAAALTFALLPARVQAPLDG
jgi:EmrB/QacA subfamily drug resistance transporter